jgi:ribosome-binding protein aMBF1 (putative translation factor)
MQHDAKPPRIPSSPKINSAIGDAVSGEAGAVERAVEDPNKAKEVVDRRLEERGLGVPKPNRVRENRIANMMSKAELARRANLSVLTVDRVEKGYGCRMHTKRKILEALGLSIADRVRVFGEEE